MFFDGVDDLLLIGLSILHLIELQHTVIGTNANSRTRRKPSNSAYTRDYRSSRRPCSTPSGSRCQRTGYSSDDLAEELLLEHFLYQLLPNTPPTAPTVALMPKRPGASSSFSVGSSDSEKRSAWDIS